MAMTDYQMINGQLTYTTGKAYTVETDEWGRITLLNITQTPVGFVNEDSFARTQAPI